jgi:hypothetical protein
MATIASFLKALNEAVQTMDAHEAISSLEFKGFDPEAYIDTLKEDDVQMTLKIACTGAIRGSNWKKIKDTHIDFQAMGYTEKLVGGKKDTTVKTITRTTAVLAPQVALFLEREKNLKKRIQDSPVPAALQFPAAACIEMSPKARQQHIEFCIEFSKLLPNGKFSIGIYNQMSKTPHKVEFKTQMMLEFVNSE